jgi:hypothetical protein
LAIPSYEYGASFNAGDPGVDCFAITPADGTNFTPYEARSIYCGGGGTVTIVTPAGSVVQWTVQPGSYINCRARGVNATGTSATGLIGLI